MGRKASLGGVAVMTLGLLTACASTTQPSDPYAKNPERFDPRARVLMKREGPAPSSEQVVAEFKALKRPIIERYVKYSGQTKAEARRSVNLAYTHIVLTDEACGFINRHTFDELALALGPMVSDSHWNGDVIAVICVAANYHMVLGRELADSAYRSPDDPGTWPGRVPRNVHMGLPWTTSCRFATLWVDLRTGATTRKTEEQMRLERNPENLQVWRRHRPVPKE